jgi:hypothetical protein
MCPSGATFLSADCCFSESTLAITPTDAFIQNGYKYMYSIYKIEISLLDCIENKHIDKTPTI